ncbi:MAG: M50 family metallopeptidase [Chloroflexota bacterium]
MNVITLLEFVLFFGLMMFVHELGHYLVAKSFRIKVEEFGFGFPPRMVKLFQFKETIFSLNWIPFGAFVRLSGENDPTIPGGFGSAKPLARIAVLLGGPVANLLLGVVLFSVMFAQTGVPDTSKVIISAVEQESPAHQAGMLSGDRIVKVNQTPVGSMEQLIQIVQQNKGRQVEIILQRGNEQITTSVVPRVDPPPGQGALGISMTNPIAQASWIQTVPLSINATLEQSRLILEMPGRLIRGEVAGEQARVVGPVGIFTMFSHARELDEENAVSADPFNRTVTLRLMTIITIALGLTNLFPIPALDGGRILFILPEIITRRRVPPQYENIVHLIGFVALILLMFYITAQDILNPIRLP